MEQIEGDGGGLFQKPIDNDALKKLCSLLKSKADKVLNGQASFSLTTDVLCRLTHDCRRHSLKQNEDESNSSDGTGLRWQSKFLGLHNKKRESTEEDWKNNIQFVKDFMLSTPSVKIIHKHGTISFPINLHRFGNLSVLELRKIPIHLVEGLQTARGRLKSLVANRCLSKPKEILESCGGDRSAPLSWQQLKYLSLIFNDIRHLDDSFRLLPDIEHIDLSHNLIDTCGNYFESSNVFFPQYLNDVLSVSLAYNALFSVPIFSVNTRNSLTTLNLRGNNLDNMQGIEAAAALKNLDVGENYMVKHTVLWPLKSLTSLCQLQLDGNPLYYHKYHRTSTISSLTYRVVTTEFVLDGKNLTRSEIMSYKPPKAEEQRALLAISPPQSPRDVSINADPYFMSTSSGIGSADASPAVINSSTPRKKGKKKKIKARDTEIRDVSYDYSSGHDFTPVGSPSLKYLEEQMEAKRLEALKTKREVELLKEHYGPDYLQAIEDRKLFSQSETASDSVSSGNVRILSKSKKHKRNLSSTKKEVSENSEGVTSSVIGNPPTTAGMLTKTDASDKALKEANHEDSEICESKNKVENILTETDQSITPKDALMEETAVVRSPISNPIMAAIERIASGQSSDESGAEKNASTGVVTSDFFLKETDRLQHENNEGTKDQVQYKDMVDKGKISERSPEKSPVSSKPLISDDQINDGANESIKKISKLSQSLILEEASTVGKDLSSLSPRSDADSSKSYSFTSSPNRSTSEVDTSTDNSLQLSESENESDAVFVTLPEEKDKMIIVTFTDLFLVEKDVRGKVTEKLDLRSLQTLETKRLRKRSSSDDIGRVEGWKNHGAAEKLEDDSKTEEMALRLKFDYIRKDRQRRCYLVDIHDGKKMVVHLQPFIDSKVEKEKAKDSAVMQCLKCNKTFSKKDLTQKSQQLPRSGSSKDFHTMKQLRENPTLICPACGSTIIIELEAESYNPGEGSNQPTPVGSYNSTGSFMESPQRQQKPAPLLRNRSFDSQSTQAKVAAKLVNSRKLSVTSMESEKSHQRTASGSGSVKSLIMSGSSPQLHQLRKTSVTETRERSNAFKAVFPPTSSASQMAQSAFLASKEQTPMESEELSYVDDHFSPDKMRQVSSSQQLAWMTSSLRGDVSTKGKDATPSHKLYKQYNSKDSEGQKQQMEDSGFESGIYLSGSSNLTSHDVDVSGNRQLESRNRKIGEREKETVEGGSRDLSERIDIPEGCKYLASMENRVNSLVKEGEYLERQEWMEKSNVRRRKNSISVSDLKKLVSTSASSRKDYIESDLEGEAAPTTFHNSGSGSSIAILPTYGNEEASPTTAHAESLDSTPVHFVIGSVEKSMDKPIAEGSSSDLNQVSSPLNSNICNSMVSSVYETSVVSSEKECISTNKIEPVVLGSSNSSKSSATDEDMPSIYDQPSNLRSGSVKCKKKRRKIKKLPSETSQTDGLRASKEEEEIPEDLTGGKSLSSSLSKQHQSSSASSEDAGAYFQARSFGTDADSDNESFGIEFDNSILEAETTFRFDHLNHRLTLYLMMSLFSNDEEFMCKIQTEVSQYIVDESYSGILIMSTQRFYVLKITSDDHSKEPEEWLSCVEVQPIPELRYIDIGLGGQSLRIEFVTDCSSFTFVTKDKEKTMQFVDLLHHNLAKHAVSRGISCKVIVNEDVDQITLENLDVDVISKGKSQQKLLHYAIGFIERGNQKLFPISFVVSTNSVCLVRTNHQWPQPRLQGPITVETVGKQFTVLERQMINNVASVEICEKSLRKLKLELFNETEGISSEWNITMTNRQNALNFIHAISEPWAKEFGVEMEVTYSQLDF